MAPTMFNWCEGLLENMKDQLTKCKTGRLKQFGYGSILVSFFLERVPTMRLQRKEWEEDPNPRDPRMKRWVEMIARHGGGPIVSYDRSFFKWLKTQLIMIEDYAYAGVNFQGDPDLVLPEGHQWGDAGKNKEKIFFFKCYMYFYLYGC
jgi:hypothetical protein